MDHVVCGGHSTVGIRDDREIDSGTLSFVYVLYPTVVVINRVHTYSDGFYAALVEFRLKFGGIAKLGGANRCVVRRMGKEYRPVVANPLVEVDIAFSRFRLEVRSFVA